MAYTVPSTKEAPMDTTAAVLVGFVLGVAAAVIGQRFFRLRFLTGLPPAQGEAVVTIWLENGEPKLKPKTASLAFGRELTWDIDAAMSAGEVVIDFDRQGAYKGPFEDKPNNPHRDQLVGRGKYRRKKNDSRSIHSNDADQTGHWTYQVTYTLEGKEPMLADPAVCIRN
jgi:hypothetical protein